MRYLGCFLLIITTTLSRGQNVLFLDSISLKPIHNVRVYHDKIVHYSDETGHVTIDNFNGNNAYAIHPGYKSKEFSSKDTVLLKPAHFILPELEISAKSNPRILINKRNRHWRLSEIPISNGSIHGVSIDLQQRLVIKEAHIYFKKHLKERIYCRLVIFNTADTLSHKPTPLFGTSTFDTIPKDTKKYTLNIAEYPLNNSLDANYIVAVEFKFHKTLWDVSLPSLEYWETSALNYYYFAESHTLVRYKPYLSRQAPEMPLSTAGIEIIATKLD
jgi:hypothetical protein